MVIDFGLVRGSAKKICPTWVGTRWDGKFPRGTENFPVPPFSRQVGRKSPRPTFLDTVGQIFLRRFHGTLFTNSKAYRVLPSGPRAGHHGVHSGLGRRLPVSAPQRAGSASASSSAPKTHEAHVTSGLAPDGPVTR